MVLKFIPKLFAHVCALPRHIVFTNEVFNFQYLEYYIGFHPDIVKTPTKCNSSDNIFVHTVVVYLRHTIILKTDIPFMLIILRLDREGMCTDLERCSLHVNQE
jgi:hypothetical protein